MLKSKHRTNITVFICTLLIGLTCLLFALKTIKASSVKVYKPDRIPFTYDPNQIENKLLGGIESRAGIIIIVDVNCYDPDNDPFKIEFIGTSPEGMFLQGHAHDPNDPNDFSEWKIYWTPVSQQQGLYYVHIKATDIPPVGSVPKSDEGTLVYFINPENRPPVLLPIKTDL